MAHPSGEPDRVAVTLRRDLSDRLEMLRALAQAQATDDQQLAAKLELLGTDFVLDQAVEAYLNGLVGATLAACTD